MRNTLKDLCQDLKRVLDSIEILDEETLKSIKTKDEHGFNDNGVELRRRASRSLSNTLKQLEVMIDVLPKERKRRRKDLPVH